MNKLNKLNLIIMLSIICIISTDIFSKMFFKYFYAYNTIDNVYLEPNIIIVNLIIFCITLLISFVIYNKFNGDNSNVNDK